MSIKMWVKNGGEHKSADLLKDLDPPQLQVGYHIVIGSL